MEYNEDATRLLLINQYDILSKIREKDSEYENYRYALEQGYTQYYPEGSNIKSGRILKDEHDLIWEILKMYMEIQSSAHKLPKDISISNDDIVFKGFDGNDDYEGVFVDYVNFIKIKKGLLPKLKVRDFNSHERMMDKYKDQLSRWRYGKNNRIWEDNKMTEDQIKHVLLGRSIGISTTK